MTQGKTIEQELIEYIQSRNMHTIDAENAIKAILSSGIVIPVSALDENVIGEAIASEAWAIEGVPVRPIITGKALLGRAAINAIKQEAGKV